AAGPVRAPPHPSAARGRGRSRLATPPVGAEVCMFEGMEPIELEHEGTRLRGYVALPDAPAPHPAVLVMHSGLGIEHGVNEPVAREFATRGYAAVCTDMYGAHLAGAPMQDAGRAMVENV